MIATTPSRCQAPKASSNGELFAIAATPDSQQTESAYAAYLLRVEESTGHVDVFRRLFTKQQKLAAVTTDLHGSYYAVGENAVQVIHENDPGRVDLRPIPPYYPIPCTGTVAPADKSPSFVYCKAFTEQVIEIPSKLTGIREGDWKDYKELRFGGVHGGPFREDPPLVAVKGGRLVMPIGTTSRVTLADLPENIAAGNPSIMLVGMSGEYIVLWRIPDHMHDVTVDPSSPPHVTEVNVDVLTRATQAWQRYKMPTAATTNTALPARLLGDWLVVPLMQWSHGQGANPCREEERAPEELDTSVPNIRDQFTNWFAVDLNIQGRFLLTNLKDGRKLTLEARCEDSEVLDIEASGAIIYRVNDAIMRAHIEGEHIVGEMLVAKDPRIEDVHWLFSKQQ